MNTRRHDLKVIDEAMKSPDPIMRGVAKINGDKIKEQLKDSWTQSARERLLEETRKGNSGNARQIGEDMIRHRGGRLGAHNRGEVVVKTFHYLTGQYERIFGHA